MKKIGLMLVILLIATSAFGMGTAPKKEEPEKASNWREYSTTPGYIHTTEDWQSFESVRNEKDYSFSIEYPKDWKLHGSVFDDPQGNKIAEFLPPSGIVLLSSEQNTYKWGSKEHIDVLSKGYGGLSEIITVEAFSIGNVHGLRQVSETVAFGQGKPITWHPITYYIPDNEKVFSMTFYERELNSDKRETFDKIISTFKFK